MGKRVVVYFYNFIFVLLITFAGENMGVITLRAFFHSSSFLVTGFVAKSVSCRLLTASTLLRKQSKFVVSISLMIIGSRSKMVGLNSVK